MGPGQVQVQGHEADNEFEAGDFAFPSSSPVADEAGSVGSPTMPAPSNRHSISPVRTTGVVNANSGGSNRRLSDSDMGSPPGGWTWLFISCSSLCVCLLLILFMFLIA